ncbi:MAG: NAD-dependent protein deacylase [Acutalibacteraceae bacterium]
MENSKINKFAELIRKSDNIVFFGGAGVSTESGMKDYRSEDGLYNTVKKYKVSPETILSHSFFETHPDVFYDFYYNYFLNTTAEPNRAHLALAELERQGKLKAVVTQNIDGLHQRAGSQNVIELHGTTLKHYCTACKAVMPNEQVKALRGQIPRCEKCNHIVRPDVVLYEEPLNQSVIEEAIDAISSADMLIIGGTSLAVYPAANFIRYFKGESIVLINRDETQYDGMATLVFRESIGEVLQSVLLSLE